MPTLPPPYDHPLWQAIQTLITATAEEYDAAGVFRDGRSFIGITSVHGHRWSTLVVKNPYADNDQFLQEASRWLKGRPPRRTGSSGVF